MDADSVPFMSTLLLEVILAAIVGPETVRFDVSTLDALRVPPMKASFVTVLRLVTVRFEVWILDALRELVTVRFEVWILDALRVPTTS